VGLQVWSQWVHVPASLEGSGRIDLYAVQRAGEDAPVLLAEAYDGEGMVAAGELYVWDINQALAALLAPGTQARRLALRATATAHGGHLDVVRGEDVVEVVATGRDPDRRAAFTTTGALLATDLNTVVRHYLALTRAATPRTIVLGEPDPEVSPARAPR
jgi:hypothetical protein